MSKFRFKLDENENVSDISFPKTNIEVKIEYPEPTEEGEVVTPSGISMGGQSMTIDQFSEIKMEKDENGQINISGGSSGGDHPWWWDWWDKINGKKPVTEDKKEGVIIKDSLINSEITESSSKELYTTTNVSKEVTIK